MTEHVINKSMDRDDLLAPWAQPRIAAINALIARLYAAGTPMTSWYGSLPEDGREQEVQQALARGEQTTVGMANRSPDYVALPGAADDLRIPWYLYWEIIWVMTHGPQLKPGSRVLDAGGTASLFSCYLASLGHELHSIDLNQRLVAQGEKIAAAMGWNLHSYVMNMAELSFADGYFDHAYSICVFEHLDHELKQRALTEMARVLRPGGVLSITFDYRNPAPYVVGTGHDDRPHNQLATMADLQRAFLSTGLFELMGNPQFVDNGKRYLVHPARDDRPYSFGALFLRRR